MRWQAIQPPRPSTSGSPVNQSCDTATIAGVTPKLGLFAARQPTNPASWERSIRKYVPSAARDGRREEREVHRRAPAAQGDEQEHERDAADRHGVLAEHGEGVGRGARDEPPAVIAAPQLGHRPQRDAQPRRGGRVDDGQVPERQHRPRDGPQRGGAEPGARAEERRGGPPGPDERDRDQERRDDTGPLEAVHGVADPRQGGPEQRSGEPAEVAVGAPEPSSVRRPAVR